MVLGEPQILGQVKQAFTEASRVGTLGVNLTPLFQHAFHVAKQVRTDTAIGSNPVSIVFAAVTLAKQIFSKLSDCTVLLIGAGETIALAAQHLYAQGIGDMIIANRSVERAVQLANRFNARGVKIQQVPELLAHADIVLSSTASQLPILGKGAVEQALKMRKHRPVLMIDLAVPRDIEPQVSKLEDVFLYAVDDLHKVVLKGQQKRLDAAIQAERIIDSQIDVFMKQVSALASSDIIRSYRRHIDDARHSEVERACAALSTGTPPQEVVETLAHRLTNKFLHGPSTQLRKAAQSGDSSLLVAARTLLKFED